MLETLPSSREESVPSLNSTDKDRIDIYSISPDSKGVDRIVPARLNDMEYQGVVDMFDRGAIRPDFEGVTRATPERVLMEEEAREFVLNEVGVEPVGDIYWWEDHRVHGCLGLHCEATGSSFVGTREDIVNPNYRHITEASTVVHELAHATGGGNRINLFLDKGKNKLISSVGANTVKIMRREGLIDVDVSGSFFEEAFAEEVASRWRQSLVGDSRDYERFVFEDLGVELPRRFINFDFKSNDNSLVYNFIGPAFAAHAISILSEKSGVDLYDLMKRMRQDPDKKAEHKRQLVGAIESVEAGLYRRLRDTSYKREDLAEACRYVRDGYSSPAPDEDPASAPAGSSQSRSYSPWFPFWPF